MSEIRVGKFLKIRRSIVKGNNFFGRFFSLSFWYCLVFFLILEGIEVIEMDLLFFD